jgi:sodium transport system ATP-binding protein
MQRTIAARTARLVEALGMEDFIDRQGEGFSQGQRTKTAIARALVHDPRTSSSMSPPTAST